MRSSVTIICLVLFFCKSFSQSLDGASGLQPQNVLQSVDNISSKSLKHISEKYNKLTKTVEVQSKKLLKHMQQKEEKLQKKLQGLDSTKAKELFAQTQVKYQEMQAKLKAPIDKTMANPLKEYIPSVDSLQTIMKFLSQSNNSLSGISGETLEKIQSVSSEIQQLQGRLQQANEIQDFIRSRESQLKSALENTGLRKELLGINKEVFYYQERLTEYKQLLHDRKKLEEKIFTTVRDLPAFQKFWQKNSYLSQLFPVPRNYGTAQALSGLQTRISAQNVLAQRIQPGVAGGTTPQQYIQEQMQQAQSELNKLKDKLNKFSSDNSDMAVPDFKPNHQKTKSFFQRLEYSLNIQSVRGTSFLPATSDLGLSLGYKLSDNKTIGLGSSYKVGWGHGFNDISISSEGVSLRSYADIKAKGSLWITGGFEYNYFQHFNSFSDIKNIDVWQRSILTGLMKKYKVGKMNGNIQLLYDFLAGKQVPQAQTFKFRIGYSF
jgi:Skp family chaperone for outer membrane proteins